MRDGDDVWFYVFGHPSSVYVPDTPSESVDDRRSAVYRTRMVVRDGALLTED